MRLVHSTLLLIVVQGLAACVSSGLSSAVSTANQKLEAQGLPFRWSTQDGGSGETMVMHMLPLAAAPSRIDAQVSAEVLTAIRQRELGKGRPTVEIQDVRPMADGREVWVLQTLGEGVAYVVAVRQAAQDVTKVELLGPYVFVK